MPLGLYRYASTDLTKSNWKQDVVYLVQFPRLPNGLPNASPYCLKIETVLRVYDIKHEVDNFYMQNYYKNRSLS